MKFNFWRSYRTGNLLVILLLTLITGVGVTGILYYQSYTDNFRESVKDRLVAESGRRLSAFRQWERQMLYNTNHLLNDANFIRGIEDFNSGSESGELTYVINDLGKIRENNHYLNTCFISASGKIFRAFGKLPDTVAILPNNRIPGLDDIRYSKTVRWHLVQYDSSFFFRVSIPLVNSADSIIAHVTEFIDPVDFFHILLQHSSLQAQGFESDLYCLLQDSDLIIGLTSNNLFRPEVVASYTNKRIWNGPNESNEEREIFDATDYRNVPIIGIKRRIPGSTTFLITNVNRNDSYRSYRAHIRLFFLFLLSLMFGAGGGILIIWQTRKSYTYKKLYENLAEKNRLEESLQLTRKYLDAILKNAPITIFVIDAERKFSFSEGKGLEGVGLNPGENVGISAITLFGQMDFTDPEGQVIKGKEILDRAFQGEILRVRNKFKNVYYDNTIAPVKQEDGTISGIIGVATDITKRAEAEIALRQSELKYRLLTEHSPDAIIVYGEGKVIYVNEKAVKMAGAKDKKQLEGLIARNLIHREILNENWDRFMNLLQSGRRISDFRDRFRTFDGRIIHLEIFASPVIYDGRNCMQVTIRDISDRVRANDKIHFQSRMLDYVGQSISAIDLEKNFIYVNSFTEKMFGRKKQEYLGHNLNEFIQDSGIRQRIDMMLEIIRRDGRWTGEIMLPGADGSLIPTLVSGTLLTDEKGNITGYIGTGSDISYQKELIHELGKARDYAQNLIENANVMVVGLNMRFEVVLFNKFACELTGYSRDEVLGSNWLELMIMKEDRKHIAERLLQIVEGNSITKEENRIVTRSGETKMISWQNSLIEEEGAKLGIISFGIDITDQKRSENSVRESHEKFKSLVDHVQKLREEDRRKIARELHDELGQSLTALKMEIFQFKKSHAKNQEINTTTLNGLMEETELIIKNLKKIVFELRPVILYDLGLGEAIKYYYEEFINRTGIHGRIIINNDDSNLDQDTATAVYRVFQESLTNVNRHSHATEIYVRLLIHSHKIKLSIMDNGKGISESEIRDIRSVGILGMQERIRSVNGKINIFGKRGSGTKVLIEIPESIKK